MTKRLNLTDSERWQMQQRIRRGPGALDGITLYDTEDHSMTDNKWAQPIKTSPVDLAFPAQVTGVFLPPIDEVPDEFKHHNGTKWNKFVSQMFFQGWDGVHPSLIKREGVDAQAGFDQVRACMGSVEPKHEHKEAGVAYLLSLFFEDVVDPEDEQE